MSQKEEGIGLVIGDQAATAQLAQLHEDAMGKHQRKILGGVLVGTPEVQQGRGFNPYFFHIDDFPYIDDGREAPPTLLKTDTFVQLYDVPLKPQTAP